MKIQLSKPVEWEEKTYIELDLDLDRLHGADSLAVLGRLRKEHPREPVLQPETDDRYILAMAARAAKVPQDLFSALPLRDFTRLKLEVQAFFMGADTAEPPSDET